MALMLILGIIVTLILIALFVWLIIVMYQEGPKPQDFTIVDNFMPQFTDGFSQGILLEVLLGETRNGYVFVPKDIDYYGRKRQKKSDIAETQLIYVDKRKVISFPRGTFSAERNRLWLLPPNPEDLPEELKSTKFGEVIMKMIEDINNNKTEVEVIREGADRVRDIYERMGDGEISEAELGRLDKMHDILSKQSMKVEERKTNLGPPSLGQI